MSNYLGPFNTLEGKELSYVGNKIYPPREKTFFPFSVETLESRYKALSDDPQWGYAAKIHNAIFQGACKYFESIGAIFVPLPLTTRMISSPGAVYGKEALNYTSDTSPIKLSWFDNLQEVFLSESSQIYLELSLLQQGVNNVFSIYNSFRKEQADTTHLAEFHHIEYEGQVDAQRNISIAESCIKHIISEIFSSAEESLLHFLLPAQLKSLENVIAAKTLFQATTFEECLKALYQDTKDPRYLQFTLQDTFGNWEQVRLTEIFDSPIAVSLFPLLEVPFYHAVMQDSNPPKAIATDFIWGGYIEILGAGQRISSVDELNKKAEIFNLPPSDYYPYIKARSSPTFKGSSGFGLGWERFFQAVLCLPEIWLACPFPRTHLGIIP